MEFVIGKLQHKNALIIADCWKYEEPYSFYDMTADIEDYNELVNEELRNGSEYFEANAGGELVGFFSLFDDNGIIDIGLGLRPDLCGKGTGREFVNRIIAFINQNYSYSAMSMDVASFNIRAIKVYESCGFTKQDSFIQETNGGKYEFIRMVKGI